MVSIIKLTANTQTAMFLMYEERGLKTKQVTR